MIWNTSIYKGGIGQMNDNPFSSISSIIDVLQNSDAKDFPPAHMEKSYFERYKELNHIFSQYPVELGAMKTEIEQWIQELGVSLEEATKIADEQERKTRIAELLSEDKIIFLNKHGPDHINKVQEKALELLTCFTGQYPSSYETFLLLCSISVHDIGNFYGRANHEKRIGPMLDSVCANVIDDSVERRVIARIAGVHGGRINGNKDTISILKISDTINNFEVREQMLAAIVRFADELADDSTRAVYPAMKANVLGSASEIYHVYSSKLHTVKLQQNPITNTWKVVLRFEIDEDTAKKQYSKGAESIYLLDEIYVRTMKMESERRYCMRYLRPFCSIEAIDVVITIDHSDSVFEEDIIKYTLEETGYPDQICTSIQDIDDKLITGAELAEKLSNRR